MSSQGVFGILRSSLPTGLPSYFTPLKCHIFFEPSLKQRRTGSYAKSMPEIHVELYGIVRHRAGTDRVCITIGSNAISMEDVLRLLQLECPALKGLCIEDGRLQDGFIANVDGQRFVSDRNALLPAGCSLLIMSNDAGG